MYEEEGKITADEFIGEPWLFKVSQGLSVNFWSTKNNFITLGLSGIDQDTYESLNKGPVSMAVGNIGCCMMIMVKISGYNWFTTCINIKQHSKTTGKVRKLTKSKSFIDKRMNFAFVGVDDENGKNLCLALRKLTFPPGLIYAIDEIADNVAAMEYSDSDYQEQAEMCSYMDPGTILRHKKFRVEESSDYE